MGGAARGANRKRENTADIFAVTTALKNVGANANGCATLVFTVTNITAAPVPGIVRIKLPAVANTILVCRKTESGHGRTF